MSVAVADYYPRTISQYVPNMTFAADVVNGKTIVNFGSPAAADPDGILDGVSATDSAQSYDSSDWETTFDGSSTSLTSTSGKLDAPFGRCLSAVGSAGADHVVTITGRDYLGQIMVENLTLVGTTTIFGNKAFKYVDSVAVAVGAADDTMDLGWTNRVGLPYKAEKLIAYTEDDVSMPVDPVEVFVEVDAVRFAAGTDVVVPSPVAGQITGVNSVVTAATTGASTATVVVVATDVAGISIVIATGASVGDKDSDTATTDDDQATSRVDKYEAIGISPDSTPSAGAANYLITVEPLTFVPGPDTDPQTATTEDPRGTVLLTTACDGSIEYELTYMCDVNDLHGVEHFAG